MLCLSSNCVGGGKPCTLSSQGLSSCKLQQHWLCIANATGIAATVCREGHHSFGLWLSKAWLSNVHKVPRQAKRCGVAVHQNMSSAMQCRLWPGGMGWPFRLLPLRQLYCSRRTHPKPLPFLWRGAPPPPTCKQLSRFPLCLCIVLNCTVL